MATVYIIRHGEKPPTGDTLSALGVSRSEALPGVFGRDSSYNIQYIMAQQPKEDGGEQRPLDTITPLAKSLGITPDTSCKRDHFDKVAKVVEKYDGQGNILICWEHQRIKDICEALNVTNSFDYPGTRFDLILEIPSQSNLITSVTSEQVSPMDDGLSDPSVYLTQQQQS